MIALIFVVIVIVEELRDETPFEVVGIWILFATGQAGTLEQEIAEMGHDAGFFRREGAVGEGQGELFQEALNFFRGDEGTGRSGKFAGEIGRARAAMRGVRVGVAEAVAMRMGGLGAAAVVLEGEAAERQVRGVVALARHGGSIAKIQSTDK